MQAVVVPPSLSYGQAGPAKLVFAVQELIQRHAKLLVEMENSGCQSMFRDDKVRKA